jgi:hypothetical protein
MSAAAILLFVAALVICAFGLVEASVVCIFATNLRGWLASLFVVMAALAGWMLSLAAISKLSLA